jgi:hypothetical protein
VHVVARAVWREKRRKAAEVEDLKVERGKHLPCCVVRRRRREFNPELPPHYTWLPPAYPRGHVREPTRQTTANAAFIAGSPMRVERVQCVA